MSRGYGKIQRALLAALDENEDADPWQAAEGMTEAALASRIYWDTSLCAALVTRGEMNAIRRALGILARDGLAVRLGTLNGDQCCWRRSILLRRREGTINKQEGVMADDADHFNGAKEAITILEALYVREGADRAVHLAQHMISAVAALIAREHGPDKARSILRIVGDSFEPHHRTVDAADGMI